MFLEIFGTIKRDNMKKSLQMSYVVRRVEGLFLSRDCSVELGIVPVFFPQVGASAAIQPGDPPTLCAQEEEALNDAWDLPGEENISCKKMRDFKLNYMGLVAACGCPLRSKPP